MRVQVKAYRTSDGDVAWDREFGVEFEHGAVTFPLRQEDKYSASMLRTTTLAQGDQASRIKNQVSPKW